MSQDFSLHSKDDIFSFIYFLLGVFILIIRSLTIHFGYRSVMNKRQILKTYI